MRWMHQLYAWWAGYFWLPCPSCGRYFGGHEASPLYGGIPVPDRPGIFKMVCRHCGPHLAAEQEGTP